MLVGRQKLGSASEATCLLRELQGLVDYSLALIVELGQEVGLLERWDVAVARHLLAEARLHLQSAAASQQAAQHLQSAAEPCTARLPLKRALTHEARQIP